MKRHIPPVLLLAVVLWLSGCAGRFDLPTEPPTSATEDTPQAAESEESTQMTTEETLMPEIDTTEPMLFLTIDGTAVDIIFFGSNSWSYTRLGHIEVAENRKQIHQKHRKQIKTDSWKHQKVRIHLTNQD